MNRKEVEEILCRDPILAGLIKQVGPYRLEAAPDRYRALVEAVVSQQLSGRVADRIIEKIHGIYGRSPTPDQILATPDSALRKVGLSRMKIAYIREISEKTEDGTLPLQQMAGMSDEEVIRVLTRIRGIGVWTAQMFLIFSLGRHDVLPTGDLGIRRRFAELYGITQEDEMIKQAEGWRPYRTVASWYLWKSAKVAGGAV